MSPRLHLKTVLASCCATIAIAAATQAARAADMPAPVPVIAPVPSDFNVFNGIEFHAQGEVGIIASPGAAGNGLDGKSINYGSLYGDHLNEPELNQILMTITKPIDTKAKGYAFGWTVQGLYGADMRTNHFLGIGTYFMGSERNQLNLIQAYGAFHLPWFTAGGVDVKAGLYSSPMGYETLDPSTSPFYSHSYTYNYGVTFNHTGILTTTHVNDTLDIYLGVDTGNQTTFGGGSPVFVGIPDKGDPNGVPAGFVGFGLNGLMNGKLTVAYYTHLGPEQSPAGDPFGYKSDMRYYNDGVFTYKINDDWQSVTELSWVHDDFGAGKGPGGGAGDYFGAVETLSYSFGKIFTLNGRAEIARDTKNTFISTPLTNNGVMLAENGALAPFLAGPLGNGTTLGDLTLGLTIKPDVPKPFALVALRPEVRYDHIFAGDALFGSQPGFTNSGKKDQFTFGGDLIVGF